MRDRVRQFMVWATKIPREEWSTKNPRFYMAVRRQDLCPSPDGGTRYTDSLETSK